MKLHERGDAVEQEFREFLLGGLVLLRDPDLTVPVVVMRACVEKAVGGVCREWPLAGSSNLLSVFSARLKQTTLPTQFFRSLFAAAGSTVRWSMLKQDLWRHRWETWKPACSCHWPRGLELDECRKAVQEEGGQLGAGRSAILLTPNLTITVIISRSVV